MKDLKFRVKSPQHREAIQKRLFELGYEWLRSKKEISYLDARYLYCQDGILFNGTTLHCYENEKHTEATLDDLYSPDFLNEDDSDDVDAFKQAFPELCRIADEMIEALNKMKKN